MKNFLKDIFLKLLKVVRDRILDSEEFWNSKEDDYSSNSIPINSSLVSTSFVISNTQDLYLNDKGWHNNKNLDYSIKIVRFPIMGIMETKKNLEKVY